LYFTVYYKSLLKAIKGAIVDLICLYISQNFRIINIVENYKINIDKFA